ncbi:MAG TPA: RHS repeat-associated core domain-containing protein [Candidatus Acidoferrum sp.]|nr:RHS repeat-associated core domain-containing protein [Candidatus Acidoferrum sp.]
MMPASMLTTSAGTYTYDGKIRACLSRWDSPTYTYDAPTTYVLLATGYPTGNSTAKERDSESGLDNFGARYMASSLGRFMSPDSTAYAKPINPQSWNLYAYAFNNPLLYIDPTGHTVSLANCKDQNQCAALLAKAGQLPDGVKATVDKKGNLKLEGDLSKIKGGNALRLLQLVQSDKTANFSIGDRSPLPGGGTQPVGGGASGTPSEGFSTSFSVVQADPSKVDSGDLSGVFLGKDGSITAGQIPGADEEETAAHELLGHVYAELIGGQPAIVNGQVNPGNLREALIAEDRVRNTDPSRGVKIRHQDSGQLIRPSDLPRITNPGSQP